MGCSHAKECPLFPLLSGSLDSWRRYYCDSADRWHDCARYRLALRGQPVPISLLPNGKDAEHIRRAADEAGPAGPMQAPPAQPSPGPQVARFEPAPGQHSPAWPVAEPLRATPTPAPPESAPARGARSASAPKRRWWTRLADWMRGPA